MRTIINSTYITLDGFIEDLQLWPSLKGPGDERGGQIQSELLQSCDAVLMGRRTYDGFVPVWPERSGDPVSDRMNALPKYVVSKTLKDPAWNNTRVIDRDVLAAVEAIEGTIVQFGFGDVSRLLLQHGLLDELRLWVHPFILGAQNGSDRLTGTGVPTAFQLTETTTLKSGIVILRYTHGADGGTGSAGSSTPAK